MPIPYGFCKSLLVQIPPFSAENPRGKPARGKATIKWLQFQTTYPIRYVFDVNVNTNIVLIGWP